MFTVKGIPAFKPNKAFALLNAKGRGRVSDIVPGCLNSAKNILRIDGIRCVPRILPTEIDSIQGQLPVLKEYSQSWIFCLLNDLLFTSSISFVEDMKMALSKILCGNAQAVSLNPLAHDFKRIDVNTDQTTECFYIDKSLISPFQIAEIISATNAVNILGIKFNFFSTSIPNDKLIADIFFRSLRGEKKTAVVDLSHNDFIFKGNRHGKEPLVRENVSRINFGANFPLVASVVELDLN